MHRLTPPVMVEIHDDRALVLAFQDWLTSEDLW